MESTHPDFQPGIRLSRADVLVLVVGSIAVAIVSPFVPWLGFAIGFVVVHFFLFCNVFRISRALELAWAALFLAMTAATLLWGSPGWLVTAGILLGATIAVVALEVRKPSYHGIGWQRINPGLREWWEAKAARRGRGG
jgi:hypothetical protein